MGLCVDIPGEAMLSIPRPDPQEPKHCRLDPFYTDEEDGVSTSSSYDWRKRMSSHLF